MNLRMILTLGACLMISASTPNAASHDRVERSGTLHVEAVRRSLAGRMQFIPNERIIVEICSLSPYLSPAQIDSLQSAPVVDRTVQFESCEADYQAAQDQIVWKMQGAIAWWPSTTIDARISRGRAWHREQYIVEENYLASIRLSHYGIAD